MAEAVTQAHIDAALAAAQAAPSMAGQDLAQVVTRASTDLDPDRVEAGPGLAEQTAPRFHVVAYDFGVKNNILRMLAERGCRSRSCLPRRRPRRTGPKPDGIFLSNGPGDPEPCDYAIAAALS